MPGFLTSEIDQAVSAATSAGLLTVTSTTGIRPGAIGYLGKSTTQVRVIVATVLSATTLTARLYPKIDDAGFGGSAGYPSNTGGSDLSAFNTGSAVLYLPEQVVAGEPDYTAFPRA